MSSHLHILAKWLPLEITEYKDLFERCKLLERNGTELMLRLSGLLDNLKNKQCSKFNPLMNDNELQLTDIEDITLSMEGIINSFSSIFPQLVNINNLHEMIVKKMDMWKDILWKVKLKLTYFSQEIISEIAYLFIYYGERLLTFTLRLSVSYNSLLDMDKKYDIAKNISICQNMCPFLMFPQRKMSVTRLLQILAYSRAEVCCHKLIDCLLETYKQYEHGDSDNESDNSSLEIFMTLTKHLSPPDVMTNTNPVEDIDEDIYETNNFENLEELILYEEKNVLDLLDIILKVAPAMLGQDGVKRSKQSGASKINTKARNKVLEYYEQILWGEVGNYLEHIILWWASCPLSARPPHFSQHLREWIMQFIPTADIPPEVVSALACLADALGVHVTSTSWDKHFRLALVAASKPGNPETGKLFAEVLRDLVMLSNQCESTPDWITGAPLDELPLVEQIPVLHRLDHSVHMTRLWAVNEIKKIANAWNVKAFFSITHGDISECLAQLNNLKTTDHTAQIEKGGLGVHVQVCALMRAKLVSEVNENCKKLKDTPKECVEGLAVICRTICLANLKMIFPSPLYWKQLHEEIIPENPSSFVDKYLDQILVPVLEATKDNVIINMILTLICESWLDYIYLNRIKFSQSGALQLLCDFGYITKWLLECPNVNESLKKNMLRNEILKRCEGVGRLLLRCPGERIRMVDKMKRRNSDVSGGKSELMPAEMYVPNQEQWLELRVQKKKNIFSVSACCGKT